MDALVKNTADAKQVRKAAKKETYMREDEVEDMRVVLSTPAGRRTIWRYLEFCGIFKFGFDPDERHETFVAGQRNVGGFKGNLVSSC